VQENRDNDARLTPVREECARIAAENEDFDNHSCSEEMPSAAALSRRKGPGVSSCPAGEIRTSVQKYASSGREKNVKRSLAPNRDFV
jgi:hypothetical protein